MLKKIFHDINKTITKIFSNLKITTDTLIFFLLGFISFAGPLFIIPIKFFPVTASKGIFIIGIALIIIIIAMIHILRKGNIIIPKMPFFTALAFVVGTSLLGTFFASSFSRAFLGYGFETTTWVFITATSILALAAFFIVRSYERLSLLYGFFLFGIVGLVSTQLLRFFMGPDFLNLGVLFSLTQTLTGSLHDFALILGCAVIVTVVALELAPFIKSIKYVLGSIGSLSFLLLVAMNARDVLIIISFVLLITAFIVFSFGYWNNQERAYSHTRKIPWTTFIFSFLSLIVLFVSPVIHQKINTYQDISYENIRPSSKLMAQAFLNSVQHNPIVGYGPNTFNDIWNQIKPASLSGNRLGSVDFSLGSGYIPTLIASQGILGLVAWVTLFAIIVTSFFTRIRKGFETALDRYVIITLITTGIYMIAIMWFTVPNASMIAFAWIVVGSYFGITYGNNKKIQKEFSFIQDPRTSFFGVFIISLTIIGTGILGYVLFQKTNSLKNYIYGTIALEKNDQQQGVRFITKAIQLANHDSYSIRLAQYYLAQLSQLTSQITEQNKQIISRQIEETLGLALGYSNQAINQSPRNYKHYVLLGSVYQSMISLGITDAYDRAGAAFKQAELLNPNDSTMKLLFANLELVNNNKQQAQIFVQQSLEQYPTADAFLVQTRIAISNNDWERAAENLEKVISINPNNISLILNLGIIQEKAGNYERANQIFSVLRNRFSDADQVINQARSSFGTETIPEIIEASPSEIEAVAQ